MIVWHAEGEHFAGDGGVRSDQLADGEDLVEPTLANIQGGLAIMNDWIREGLDKQLAFEMALCNRSVAAFRADAQAAKAERDELDWQLYVATAMGAGEGMADWKERQIVFNRRTSRALAEALAEGISQIYDVDLEAAEAAAGDRGLNESYRLIVSRALAVSPGDHVRAMDALAASPFALIDAHGNLRLVIDAVHENDALCLALTCHAMRDALGVRFPACPRAGGRAVAELAARVTADGVLDLSFADDGARGLRALPEGFGRLAYLPGPSAYHTYLGGGHLRVLNLSGNEELTTLPEGLWSLVGLEELNLSFCGLRALPEGIGAMAGLRKLGLRHNEGLTALPEGLWSLVGLEDLSLVHCNMMVLPEGVVGLAGLRALDLRCNMGLTTLPAGLGRLRNLKVLYLVGCPGLAALRSLQSWGGLPALLAHLAAQGAEPDQDAQPGTKRPPGQAPTDRSTGRHGAVRLRYGQPQWPR
jgi:hypothetical protein